ncbi:hypothetical protein A2U01_0005209, partial [Trifolium medium]|nr:hypothetical protein [Trifolium medium]
MLEMMAKMKLDEENEDEELPSDLNKDTTGDTVSNIHKGQYNPTIAKRKFHRIQGTTHNQQALEATSLTKMASLEDKACQGIYGYSKHHQKPMTCDLITNLYQTNHHENWLLFGDFNLVLNSAEKEGGKDLHSSTTSLFHNTLNQCDLMDLGYHGDKFTWTNNQENESHIKERLDRFCASPSWVTKFPRCTNYHLLNYSSDHKPILLVFGSNHDFREDTTSKRFIKRFENIWLKDPKCLQIIKEEWNKVAGATNFKLQQVFEKVHNWGRDTYGNSPKQIKATLTKLQELKTTIPNSDTKNQINLLETKLDGLLSNEEQWWAHRAKNKDIQATFQDYFTELFTSSNPINTQETINVVANLVTPHMYDNLNSEFTAAEVSFATHQLKGNAAPGPDGLNASFYQAYWDTIGGDITQTVLEILNNGGNPDPYNNTFICLIPKHNNPTCPADFRPIAL